MASMSTAPPKTDPAPVSARTAKEREALPSQSKTRAERFEEAHAWVLAHHGKTFEKLAK